MCAPHPIPRTAAKDAAPGEPSEPFAAILGPGTIAGPKGPHGLVEEPPPFPDAIPDGTAVSPTDEDAAAIAQKRHAERLAEIVRMSEFAPDLLFICGSTVPGFGPFIAANTKFLRSATAAFNAAYKLSQSIGPLCAPCTLSECRATRIDGVGWQGTFTLNLEA